MSSIIREVSREVREKCTSPIGSTVAAEEESRILGTNRGSALLVIKQPTHDTQDIPIEYRVSLPRGDRYTHK